jgi:hypothetical protein
MTLCALILAAAYASPTLAEEYAKTYPVSGQAIVRVRVDDSSVQVMTSDTPEVSFHVTTEGFSAIDIGRKLHIDSRQDGNQIELTVHLSAGVTLGFSNRRITTVVRMPKNADLQLETSDGRVELSDLTGNITVHTSDGAVKASRLSGTIDLRSNDGEIVVDTLAGTFKLHSGDGKINATSLDGKCDVSTSDGSIHVAGRFDALDIKSGDGAVTARAQEGSKMSAAWNIATKDGDVDVTIPKSLQANLDASTSDGHISLGIPVLIQGDLGKKTVRGTINGGGAVLYIHTSDGTIHINGS